VLLEQELNTIIANCLSGNRKAQEQLYRQLYGLAMSIAVRYSRDEMDAGDIVSHSFVKLFKHLHQFDEEKGSIHAWLKTILIHEALDHIKQRNRFGNEELDKAEEYAVSNNAIERIDASALMGLIRQLPPATQAVFTLYVVDGFNHREIAERLGISDGTSKWHLSEARKLLQKKLSDYNLP
jgi:RNA polymerase sigma factor (sigma-70 family)